MSVKFLNMYITCNRRAVLYWLCADLLALVSIHANTVKDLFANTEIAQQILYFSELKKHYVFWNF